jgi:hypothetical protein
MRKSLIFTAALVATACAGAPSFDIETLKPTAKGEQVSLTGRFELSGLQFRLFPGNGEACLSGALTSLAGLPPPEYTNRTMTLTGELHLAEPEGAIKDACNRGLVMLANDVSVPD